MNRLPHLVLKEIGFTLLAEGKILKIKAEGYSMYPTVKPGSIIYIDNPADSDEPVPGEIIAWKKDSGFIVHRLVRVEKDDKGTRLVTRGDSCLYEDESVAFDKLAGRVVRIETGTGNIVPESKYSQIKPLYSINRFRVRLLFRFLRILKISGIKN
jgi:signal peptidase I